MILYIFFAWLGYFISKKIKTDNNTGFLKLFTSSPIICCVFLGFIFHILLAVFAESLFGFNMNKAQSLGLNGFFFFMGIGYGLRNKKSKIKKIINENNNK